MAYKTISELSADVTITLGGFNKKLGKNNPTKIEGFYIGKKEVVDTKKKTGFSNLYFLQTPKGTVGVWGKTKLDQRMASAVLGRMTLITQEGMQDTPNGPMYLFKVAQDPDLTTEVQEIHVESAPKEEEGYGSTASFDDEDADLYDDEPAVDEVKLERPKAPVRPAAASSAKDRALALLKSRNSVA